jgi:hypothetical protein
MIPEQCGPGALAGATEANHYVFATTCSPDSAAGQASGNRPGNSDSITILHARGRRLAKVISADSSITDYDSARLYDLSVVELAGLEALESLLRRLAHRPDCCIVRGTIADPSRTRKVRRLLYHDRETDDPPTLRDEPRRWLALDIDSLPRPEEIAPRDLAGCAGIAIKTLPREFHATRCIVQATGSHGLKPGIRLRLWYWLTWRVATRELRRWLRGSPVDHAIFSPAQITYTAAPLLGAGAIDPVPERLLPLPGSGDCVAVPAAAVLAPARAATSNWRSPESGDPGAAQYGFAALAAATARVARAPEGQRHPTLLAEARGLAGLVTRRLLSERAVAEALAGAAALAGLPDGEAAAAIAWALAHPRSASR